MPVGTGGCLTAHTSLLTVKAKTRQQKQKRLEKPASSGLWSGVDPLQPDARHSLDFGGATCWIHVPRSARSVPVTRAARVYCSALL